MCYKQAMGIQLADRLQKLRGVKCAGVDATGDDAPPVAGNQAPELETTVRFEDGTKLSAVYWRLVHGRSPISVFDHRQRYGLPAPIDAIQLLRKALQGQAVTSAELDRTTGDLRFGFESGARLEVFNFTGYEIWEITFPDGTGELSNYALQES